MEEWGGVGEIEREPVPYHARGTLELGGTKPGIVWIRVGSWLTTDGIQLAKATGSSRIAAAK